MENVLTVKGLSKNFGKVRAVENLDLTVPSGSVFGILGPNGSGKTTSLGMILGVTNPSSGTYDWFGMGQSHQARLRLGAILETPCFYHYLSGEQNLQVVAEIKRASKGRVQEVLEKVGLASRKQDSYRAYSLGMKQRLSVASALLNNPEVIVLDEPTNGLDPQGIAEVRRLIQTLSDEGHTIIIASHLLDEVQRVCTDFAVLRSGKKIYQGSVSDLNLDSRSVLVSASEMNQLESGLSGISGVTYVREGNSFRVKLSPEDSVDRLHSQLIHQGVVLTALIPENKTLEQKFLEVLQNE